MGRLLALSVMMLSLTGSIVVPAAPPGYSGTCAGDVAGDRSAGPAQNDTGRPMATSDGLYWMDDLRLTNNGGNDLAPAIATDSFSNSLVMYYRQGTHYFSKVDRDGYLLSEEKALATAGLSVQHCGQPTGRLGVDAQDNWHVLWSTGGLYGPTYQKLASNGNPLCQPMDLSDMLPDAHATGLTAGKNNRVYIAYENGSNDRIEMAYLDNNFNLHIGYLATMGGEGITIGLDQRNNPFVFSRDASNGSLSFTKFSPEGHLMMSPARVSTSLTGTGLPMPALAFGTDGAVHLLEASSASGVRALYYTKLGASGENVTGRMLITDNASDFGDICVDDKRNVFIIWGNAADEELRYVRIEPNKENDTLRPVKLTSSSGSDRDPQIAADREGSLHVVWSTNRDGNREVYYKCALTYGVELTMALDEMEKMMYVHQNETRTGNITVRNMGGQNDTIFLGVDADFYGKPGGFGQNYTGEGYNIWMEGWNRQFDLDAQEIRKVPIHVRGSPTGQPNEYITVIAYGTSFRNPNRNDTVQFRVYLVVDDRIKLECLETVHTTPAGVPTRYSLSLMNVGDANGPINVAAKGPPCWNCSLNLSEVWLRPREHALFSLDVTPRPDAMADEVGVVTVTAWRAGAPYVSESVKTFTVVTPFIDIVMAPDRTEDTVDPGGIADYILTICSHSNMNGHLNLILEAVFQDTNWSVSLDAASIVLTGEDSGFVVLRVIPPIDAPAGSNLSVRVACFDAKKRYGTECCLTTFVGQVRDLGVSVAPEELSLYPGGKTAFMVTVTNLGNGPDNCTLGSLAIPPMWDCSLWGQDGQMALEEGIEIPHQGTGWFDVVVGAPLNATAGICRITGTVFDGAGRPYELAFTVSVNQVYGVSIASPAPQQAGEPQQRVAFTVEVSNTGNGNDALLLTAAGLPAGWRNVEFRDADNVIGNRPYLAAGRACRMQAILGVPASTPLDNVSFQVIATSEGGANASLELRLNIVKADLSISGIELLSSILVVGKPVMVKVSVRNGGEAAAANVSVAYYRNGVLRTTENLGRMAAGENRTTTLVWVPLDGQNVLRFVADPKDTVCERNETDNEVTVEKRLHTEKVTILTDDTWMILAAAIPAIAIGLVLATYTAWRRRTH